MILIIQIILIVLIIYIILIILIVLRAAAAVVGVVVIFIDRHRDVLLPLRASQVSEDVLNGCRGGDELKDLHVFFYL